MGRVQIRENSTAASSPTETKQPLIFHLPQNNWNVACIPDYFASGTITLPNSPRSILLATTRNLANEARRLNSSSSAACSVVLFDSTGAVSRRGRFRVKTGRPRLGFANAAANKHCGRGDGGQRDGRWRRVARGRQSGALTDSRGWRRRERVKGVGEDWMERETSAIGLAVNSGDTSGWLGWFRIYSKPALTTLVFDELPDLLCDSRYPSHLRFPSCYLSENSSFQSGTVRSHNFAEDCYICRAFRIPNKKQRRR